MLAAGMIPSVATEPSFGKQGLGLDCAGRIARVGAETGTFAVGDEVLAIAPTALASFSNTRMELVARKPAHLSFEQAAAIPCAFVTAHYALERLARLAKGERILIHAATGGVGLAALQIAHAIGAEVFATAGSPEKRAYLKKLGVKWIMDSRSLLFADEILEITNGGGVDVVLNSLAGEAIPRGIALLNPYGRFVEIGKRDIYGDSKIGLLAFRKNLSFFAVDLDRLCNERPALAGEMLREVVARFESGIFQPLPQEVFPASEAEAAVRQMAQARHMGKIVLQTDDPKLRIVNTKAAIRSDATYLIAGGLGGFGLATARWLVREGARSLVLMGRSDPAEIAQQTIAGLRSAGAQVTVAKGDVTAVADVRRIVGDIRATLPPLRGVFHAAMVLDDAALPEMTWPRFEAALPAKMAGAWNLHRETRVDPLDYFVLYSSIATIFGNPMQSNYSAANAFLDGLAHHRQALGLPALAVNWGVLEDVGYVSQHREIGHYLSARGYDGFTSEQALEALGQLLVRGDAQAVVARIDWERLAASSPATMAAPGFQHLLVSKHDEGNATNRSGSMRQTLMGTADVAERAALLEQFLRQKVGKALGLAPQRLDVEKPLTESGLDSLIAVELVTVLKMELGFELAAVKILQGLTIRGLAALIENSLGMDSAELVVSDAKPLPAERAAVPQPIISEGRNPATVIRANGAHDPAKQTRLADASPPAERKRPAAEVLSSRATGAVDYATLNFRDWSPAQKSMRWLSQRVFAAGARVRVEGQANLPKEGGYIIAVNHLSLADVPLVLTIMPRPVILLAADWLRESAATRWFLQGLGNSIFVRRGEGDGEAVQSALSVLKAGGIIGLSPEGTRSKSGTLEQTQLGMAYLALIAEVPIVPIASWGHERLWNAWRRGKRPEVNIRVGAPIRLIASDVSAAVLRQQTDLVMRDLAALLPREYRGVYGDAAALTRNEP